MDDGLSLLPVETHEFQYGWLIVTIILSFILLVILVLYIKQSSTLIDPSKCPKIQGNFGVRPGLSGTVLNSCGNNNNEECVIIATNLNEAVNICMARADICQQFSYDLSQGKMRILNPKVPLTSGENENTYILQVGRVDG